jgi:site-specific DNA recombinase
MMRCAAYARFSSELQRKTSIDDQMAVVRRYAREQKWDVIESHVYKDEAVSASSIEGRPGLEALLEAAAMRPLPFDVLLVDDSSRVARDLADALRLMQRLRFSGVRVIYISQQIDSHNEQAETLIAMHGIVDSLFLKELGKKTRRGLAGQLSRGYATGGRTFGYRTEKVLDPSGKPDCEGNPASLGHSIAVDVEEAIVVRRVFERYASGVGIGTIVEELNHSGAAGPRGQRWCYSSVRRTLNNERYRGQQVWGQKTYERRPGSRRKVARTVQRSEWRIKERPDLLIVPDELWNRVQARFADVSSSVRRQPGSNLLRGRNGAVHSRHLFSGVMRCSMCGGAMGVVAGGHGSPRYGCQRSWRNGRAACTNRLTVRAKVADAELLSGLQARLKHVDTLTYVTEAVSTHLTALLDDGPRRLNELSTKRTEVKRSLTNLMDSLEKLGPTSDLVQRVRSRQIELASLEQELESIHEPCGAKLSVIPSWVRRQLADVGDLLQDEPQRVKAHLRRIGLRFAVSPIHDEGRPFLQVTGTADLLGAIFERQFDFPATGRSRPGSAQ